MHVLGDKMKFFSALSTELDKYMTTNVLCYIVAVAVIALVLGPGCIQSAALVLNSSKTKNVREKLLKMLARLADAC